MSNYEHTSIVELASIIAGHLEERGIRVVLVGGLAVEIYTENLYLTKDIDMINTSYHPPSEIHSAMAEIGFQKKGRIFVNETTDISVEFPSAPLSVGEQLIKETTTIVTDGGEIPILFPQDVVKDRLAAYFHWNDRPSLVQALAVMINHSIPTEELKLFCLGEGEPDQFEVIETLWRSVQETRAINMAEIESLVIQHTVLEL